MASALSVDCWEAQSAKVSHRGQLSPHIQGVNPAGQRRQAKETPIIQGSGSWPWGRKGQVCTGGALRTVKKVPGTPRHGPSEDPGGVLSEQARAAGPPFSSSCQQYLYSETLSRPPLISRHH